MLAVISKSSVSVCLHCTPTVTWEWEDAWMTEFFCHSLTLPPLQTSFSELAWTHPPTQSAMQVCCNHMDERCIQCIQWQTPVACSCLQGSVSGKCQTR